MTISNTIFLQEPPLLDFNAPVILALIEQRGWGNFDLYARIGAIYDFVRNEIFLATMHRMLCLHHKF